MLLIDVNILIGAHRTDHPQHGCARKWLEELIASTEQFSIPSVVLSGFVRVSTSPSIFNQPSSLDQAFDFLAALLAQPNCVTPHSGTRFNEIFRQTCVDHDVWGNLVSGAFLAAHAIEIGAGIASFDRDFSRFTNLKWVNPAD